MLNLFLATLLLQKGIVGSGIADCLSGIQIRPATQATAAWDYPGLTISSSEPIRSVVALGLPQTVEGYALTLVRGSECSASYRVQWQFETSVTVMDEGPHVDLTDWKHFTSPWADIEPAASGEFLLPAVSEQQAARFPPTSAKELRKVVQARFGTRWANLIDQTKKVGEGQTRIGLSSYRLQVLVGSGTHWDVLYKVEFRFPMGC